MKTAETNRREQATTKLALKSLNASLAFLKKQIAKLDAEIARRVEAAPPDATVILDMAVLVESDLGKGQYSEVLVIEAPLQDRLDRLSQQRGMDPADARARIASQVSDEARRAVADHVVVNDGDVGVLRQRLEAWWAAA